jgi:hypothetical protein
MGSVGFGLFRLTKGGSSPFSITSKAGLIPSGPEQAFYTELFI